MQHLEAATPADCKLQLQGIGCREEPRVGDLLLSHPAWSVLQANLDYSVPWRSFKGACNGQVVLLVAVDALKGVTGLLLNKSHAPRPACPSPSAIQPPEDQTLGMFLADSDGQAPQGRQIFEDWMLEKPLAHGGPVQDGVHWIQDEGQGLSFGAPGGNTP